MKKNSETCFVMMPFDSFYRSEIFNAVIKPIISLYGLDCIIADHHGADIFEQIETGIKTSKLCIADISNIDTKGKRRDRSNVLYELGAAHILDKKVILIARKHENTTLPFVAQKWKVILYNNPNELRESLLKAFDEFIEKDLTRFCLVPEELRRKHQARFMVFSNPLTWRRDSRITGGFDKLADVGDSQIAALLFSRLNNYGLLTTIANPYDYRNHVLEKTEMNIYCIGSTRANPWTGKLLEKLSRYWAPRFHFNNHIKKNKQKSHHLGIFDGRWMERFGNIPPGFERDIGLVVRAPNPFHQKYMVMILAGRRVTGTEAAYYSLFDLKCLSELAVSVDLDDHRQAFWMIVEMSRHGRKHSYRPDLDSLKPLEVRRFKPKPRKTSN